MKMLLGCVAAMAVASIGACTPAAETKTEAPVAETKPEPAPAPPAATVAYAGKWDGTISCYKMDSPLHVTIDAATPAKASVSMGDTAALTWDAAVTYDEASRMVTLTGPTPTADAAVIKGALSADGASISGAMEKQLCTKFSLKRPA